MNMRSDSLIHTESGAQEAKLLNSFFVLYKNARIYESSNPVFKRQCSQVLELLHQLSSGSDNIAIKAVDGHFFVNATFVRFDASEQSGADDIVQEWEDKGIGGVEFPADITFEELEYFFTYKATTKLCIGDFDTSELVSEEPSKTNRIRWLTIPESRESIPDTAEEMRRQFRAAARKTFKRALTIVQEVIVQAESGEQLNISKTKRVVHSLIDHIVRDESSMLELTAIKDYDVYTYAHSVNVSVYALTVGVHLGLDRPRLSQLGYAAIFHDIGKIQLPHDLIHKPDAFDEDDWRQMQLHPLLGAKTILRNMKLDIHTARAARGAFEHHINADFTGYPKLHYKKRTPNLFSKIISIVDSFDALVSGRVYMKKMNTPEIVITKMRNHMAVKFDPFLLDIFHRIIGVYPAGSLVLLSTDELALVLTNNDEHRDRPYVKIVGNRHGLLDETIWVDLASPEHAHRTIIRPVNPQRYGLNVRDFILDD